MDVPARASYVTAVASPRRGPATSRFINVLRSWAPALSLTPASYMLAVLVFSMPPVVCGALKIVYDLALLRMFQAVKPLEGKRESP